jgi:hypothetical protein
MESYMQDRRPVVVDDSIIKHYRDRCGRLEGELHDADRKLRLQVDEIMQLKRDLSKDRTETLLSHQKEISELKEAHRLEAERLKENHRRDTREFERQIIDLERQAFKMELEHRSGGRTTGHRLLDMLEEVAPTLFENLTGALGGALTSPGHPGLTAATGLSPEQAADLQREYEQLLATGQEPGQGNPSTPLDFVPPSQPTPPPSGGEMSPTSHRPAAMDTGESVNGLTGRHDGPTETHTEEAA